MRTNQILRAVLPTVLILALSACSSENSSTSPTAPVADPGADGAAVPPPAAIAADTPVTPAAWDGRDIEGVAFDHCSLDAVNGITAAGGQFVVNGGEPIVVEGWIAGPGPVDPGTFMLHFKGPDSFKVAIPTGVLREDVSAALSTSAVARTGFKATLAPSVLPSGEYQVQLRVTTQGKEQACAQRSFLRVK